ncbi:FAD-binding oxidoreductase [Actinocorallia aurantiaca]|uniref:FAD-binding oxidoreductase n=1 Tax=Actinocorallia aurantiaca TaxID=46204 RepID=A0ABN3UR36_9ACTN
MHDRRDLLRAGLLAAGGLATGLFDPTAADALRRAVPDRSAWRNLRRALSPASRLYFSSTAGYTALALPQNLRYSALRPAGIVSCGSARDVQTAVRWAVRHGMPLAPRSGGHNYAGYSTTTGLLIDLRRIRAVSPRGDRLAVGGGATNSDVYRAGTGGTGLYFPGGRCPGVGVAGLTLGGGLGFNDRRWGLTCDRLVETRVVLSDGTLVRATERENADLFWACRGGAGGNFGVNTAFVFDAVRVDRQVSTVFDLSFSLKRGVEVMDAVREMLQRDERAGRLDVRVGFAHPGEGKASIAVLGQYLGTDDRLRKVLAPLLALSPTRRFIEQRGFWRAQDRLALKSGREAMAAKSLVPTRWPDEEAITAVMERIGRWRPGLPGNSGHVTLFAMGGAVSALAPSETAFPHRRAVFVIDIGASWSVKSSVDVVDGLIRQIRAIYDVLARKLRTSAAYVNFPDPDLPGWHTAYYGANYDRLAEVKSRYDPSGVFRYGQSIGSPLVAEDLAS